MQGSAIKALQEAYKAFLISYFKGIFTVYYFVFKYLTNSCRLQHQCNLC
jgi:hypothetical protein